MRIENCPKNLNHCPKQMCPLFPCWAYEKQMAKKNSEGNKRDDGWE